MGVKGINEEALGASEISIKKAAKRDESGLGR